MAAQPAISASIVTAVKKWNLICNPPPGIET
jgi:hypothetical protein